jgi:hypothetical protein
MFSGKELPSNLTTDTGLIKLRFTSDASLDVSGAWTAQQARLALTLQRILQQRCSLHCG